MNENMNNTDRKKLTDDTIEKVVGGIGENLTPEMYDKLADSFLQPDGSYMYECKWTDSSQKRICFECIQGLNRQAFMNKFFAHMDKHAQETHDKNYPWWFKNL